MNLKKHILVLALSLAALPAAAHVNVFGPKTYNTAAGAPQPVTETIALSGPCELVPNAVYTLVVANDGVSSASISVNGVAVVAESDLNQGVTSLERTIVMAASNTLTATIKGGTRAGTLTLSIRRHIDLTEMVFGEKTYTTTAKAESFRESFRVADLTGPFSIIVRNGEIPVAASVRVNGVEIVTEQDLKAALVVRRSVTLAASNELAIETKKAAAGGRLSVAIVRHLSDTAGPQIVHGRQPGQIVASSPLPVSGTVTDSSGVAAFAVNGTPVIPGAGGTFSTSITLAEGANTIQFEATDCEGNVTRTEVTVQLENAPVLTIDAPREGAFTGSLTVAMSGTVTSMTGVQSVFANGTAMTVNGTSWSGNVILTAGDGAREITVVATDTAGRQTTQKVTVRVDTTAPAVQIGSPADDVSSIFIANAEIAGTASDATSGVAGVTCNGIAATLEDGLYRCIVPLQAGANTIAVTAVDALGNTSAVTRTLTRVVDTNPPTITSQKPAPNEFGWHGAPVTVSFVCADDQGVAFCSSLEDVSADGAGQVVTGKAVDGAGNETTVTATINLDSTAPLVDVDGPSEIFSRETSVSLSGTASDATSGLYTVVCGTTPATIDGGAFQCTVPLAAGWQALYVTATDRAGNARSSRVSLFHDATPPTLVVVEPAGSITTNDATVTIDGIATDDDQIASVTIDGAAAILAVDGAFVHVASLAEGTQSLAIAATDRAGNTVTTNLAVQYVRRAAIRITSPADFSVTNGSSVTVTGTLEGSVAGVNVNGVPATISGNTFTAAGVPLAQGRTNVTAFATTQSGQVATDQLNLFRDSIPPRVEVYTPAADEVVTSPGVTVSGMVDDIVIGTINAGQVRVTVNGIDAVVANRAFMATGITLSPGQNALSIVAVDQAGNSETISHRVTFDASAAVRIVITGGDMQTATIGAALPQPLAVRVTNASGAAMAGADVLFEVVQNDGELSANGQSGRNVTVATDANGAASVRWTIGNRAGAGNNVVRASVAGASAPATFHAAGQFGAAALIVVDSGDNQFGVSNERLQRPLVAAVVDAGSNRLAGVPVTFTVLEGGGSFDGTPSVTVITDSDGRAWATPRLGPSSGMANNAFVAAVQGLPSSIFFRVSGRVAGPVEQTRLSGVVLDNSNVPVAGVTMRIDETDRNVRTDAQGQFSFDAAPVGYVKLIADGSTVERPGTWPMLEFVLYTNAGQNNTIGMPIYMLPIDVMRGIQVTETTGGTLTIPELPGFALEVAPGSALFPNGSRAGTVSATLVHSDKVPMTPGFGQQPRFIVTIQPPGVHFDPPAALTLPNLDGLGPGEVTEMYSFDHDLGQFIAIGTASASEDGTTIVSDPGVGIIKGGWHCGGAPTPSGTACAVTLDGFAEITDEGGDPTEPTASTARTPQSDAARPQPRVQANATGPSFPVGLVGTCAKITAQGSPLGGLLGIGNGSYSGWAIIDDPTDPLDHPNAATFVSAPNCTNVPKCEARIKGQMDKVATVKVNYTVGSTTREKKIKVRFVSLNASAIELSLSGDSEIPIRQDSVMSDPSMIEADNWYEDVADPVWKNTYTAAQVGPSAFPMDDDVEAKVKFRLTAPLPVALPNMRLVGEFDVPGPIPGISLTARFRSDVITIPAGQTTIEVDDIETTYKPVSTMYFNPMSIRWKFVQVKNGGCPIWVEAGTTNVPVYYTLDDAFDLPVYRTALHLAVAGIYATNEAEATNQLWNKFSIGGNAPANVKNWNGVPLQYYPAGRGFEFIYGIAGSDSMHLLLASGFSGCYGFRFLFVSALNANGIEADPVKIVAREGSRFMVKKWDLGSAALPPSEPWRFELFLKLSGGYETMVPEPGDHIHGRAINLEGVRGQNSPWPSEKVFQYHAIVKLEDGRYVDPSYGLVYTGEMNFQQRAVDGYLKLKEGYTDRYYWVKKPDSTNGIVFLEPLF